MNRKRAFVYLLLAILMIAGVFGPPLAGRGVRAAPSSIVVEGLTLTIVNAPPANMCVDDTVPVTIQYSFNGYRSARSAGNIHVEPYGGSGLVRPRDFPINSSRARSGSGTITTRFTALLTGDAGMTITGTVNGVTATQNIGFNIVDCQKVFFISALAWSGEGDFAMETIFSGEGGMSIDPNSGNITGGGTYRYSLEVYARACREFTQATDESTFDIRGTRVGEVLNFSLDFATIQTAAVNAECDWDGTGTYSDYPLIPSETFDPDSTLPFSQLTLYEGEEKIPFPFGEGGEGYIRVINRK